MHKKNSELIVDIVIEALKQMRVSRFFRTERGFQGRFACALYAELDERSLFPDDAIIEEEYQKRLGEHGTRLRPDLIIHIPVESSLSHNRRANNFVVFAFKKEANDVEAKEDFNKIDKILSELDYLMGIFININGASFLLSEYEGRFHTNIHEFLIRQNDNEIYIGHAFFKNNVLRKEDIPIN